MRYILLLLILVTCTSINAQVKTDSLKQAIQLVMQRNYILTEEVNVLRGVNDNLTKKAALLENEVGNCELAKNTLVDGFNKMATSYEDLFTDYKKLEEREKRRKGLFWKGAGIGVITTLVGIILIK